MTNYIESQARDGTLIRIEVETQLKGVGFGRQPASLGEEVSQNVYEQTLQTIQACANGMVDTLQNLKTRPNSASIEFAVKIDGDGGAMIAKSVNSAHFKVTLSWKEAETDS